MPLPPSARSHPAAQGDLGGERVGAALPRDAAEEAGTGFDADVESVRLCGSGGQFNRHRHSNTPKLVLKYVLSYETCLNLSLNPTLKDKYLLNCSPLALDPFMQLT